MLVRFGNARIPGGKVPVKLLKDSDRITRFFNMDKDMGIPRLSMLLSKSKTSSLEHSEMVEGIGPVKQLCPRFKLERDSREEIELGKEPDKKLLEISRYSKCVQF